MGTRRFDPLAYRRLRDEIGASAAREVTELALDNIRTRLQAARAGIDDLRQLQESLHSIVPSAGYLGAVHLQALAEDGVQKLRAGEALDLPRLLHELEEEHQAARRFVESNVKPDRKTVAIAEDNSDNRLLVRALLRERYELLEFEAGADALQAFEKTVPDLVLLDISLPGMDGAEVLRRLRADERLRRIPVIALTAHAMPGDREAYLQMGFDGYVPKPIVDLAGFQQAVQDHLTGSEENEKGHD